MKRLIEGAAAAAMAIALAGPAQAVVTGTSSLSLTGPTEGSHGLSQTCRGSDKNAVVGVVDIAAGQGSCEISIADGPTFAKSTDTTQKKLDAGDGALGLKLETGVAGVGYIATATATTGVETRFSVGLSGKSQEPASGGATHAQKEHTEASATIKKAQAVEAATMEAAEAGEQKETDAAAEEKTPTASAAKKHPDAAAASGAHGDFDGTAKLLVDVDGFISWVGNGRETASGALKVTYGVSGGTEAPAPETATVDLFTLIRGTTQKDCARVMSRTPEGSLPVIADEARDCTVAIPGEPDEDGVIAGVEKRFGLSTYEFLLGFDYGKKYTLSVDLILSAQNGAAVDFSKSAKLSLDIPQGVEINETGGDALARAFMVSVVPVPPAALLLLSGFGVAAVVRRRAAA